MFFSNVYPRAQEPPEKRAVLSLRLTPSVRTASSLDPVKDLKRQRP
jgi:hypothetical protein